MNLWPLTPLLVSRGRVVSWPLTPLLVSHDQCVVSCLQVLCLWPLTPQCVENSFKLVCTANETADSSSRPSVTLDQLDTPPTKLPLASSYDTLEVAMGLFNPQPIAPSPQPTAPSPQPHDKDNSGNSDKCNKLLILKKPTLKRIVHCKAWVKVNNTTFRGQTKVKYCPH